MPVMIDHPAPPLGERLERAFALAVELHRDQIRKKTRIPYVAHVMRTDYPVVNFSETLWTALEVLRTHKLAAVPVVRNGALHGMLTLDDIRRASHRLRRHL